MERMILRKNRILILDSSYEISDCLKVEFLKMKGKHYKNLKPSSGWTFPLSSKKELEEYLLSLSSSVHINDTQTMKRVFSSNPECIFQDSFTKCKEQASQTEYHSKLQYTYDIPQEFQQHFQFYRELIHTHL